MEISDTGVGISAEDKARLFEPYFSKKKSGTGLGLAIVSNIIADHNGYIRVKDNIPRGTRFVIELPVKAGMSDSPLLQRGDRGIHENSAYRGRRTQHKGIPSEPCSGTRVSTSSFLRLRKRP